MRISLNWLRELVDCDLSPQELEEKLTMAGFEVESIEDRRTWAEGVVIGHILTADRHPNADKLQVCKVDIGLTKRSKGTFPGEEVYRIIDGRKPVKGHGGPDMPVWGDAFKASTEGYSEEKVKEKIEALVDFLRSIQVKAS